MTATLQSASERLHQLENDNVDLTRNFAELEKLREMVRQKEVSLPATRVYRRRSTVVATEVRESLSWISDHSLSRRS
jgi:hypothetical protein